MRGMTFLLGVLMTGTIQASALTPFTAHYQVFEGGKAQGEASLQLSSAGRGEWRYDMNVRGTSGGPHRGFRNATVDRAARAVKALFPCLRTVRAACCSNTR